MGLALFSPSIAVSRSTLFPHRHHHHRHLFASPQLPSSVSLFPVPLSTIVTSIALFTLYFSSFVLFSGDCSSFLRNGSLHFSHFCSLFIILKKWMFCSCLQWSSVCYGSFESLCKNQFTVVMDRKLEHNSDKYQWVNQGNGMNVITLIIHEHEISLCCCSNY